MTESDLEVYEILKLRFTFGLALAEIATIYQRPMKDIRGICEGTMPESQAGWCMYKGMDPTVLEALQKRYNYRGVA